MRAVSKHFPARLVVDTSGCAGDRLSVTAGAVRTQLAIEHRSDCQSSHHCTRQYGRQRGATYTVKRDSLKQSLSLQGRVAPTRSAQLTLHGGGTVTAVSVQAGQAVKQGDSLAEFAADDQSLQSARAQATLAELAYEQELTKLNELQTGHPRIRSIRPRPSSRVTRRPSPRSTSRRRRRRTPPTRAPKAAATVAKAAADRKVQLAQVALQTAKDTLAAAQDAAKEAEDATKTAQTKEQSDAAAAVVSAKQAVTATDRALKSANIKLSQAKLNWATTSPARARNLQFKINQDTDALKDAKAAAQAAQDRHRGPVGGRGCSPRGCKPRHQADQLELKHQQTNLASAKTVDDAAIQQATLDQQSAQDALTQAQTAQQKAEQRVQTLASQQAAASAALGLVESADARGRAGRDQAGAARRRHGHHQPPGRAGGRGQPGPGQPGDGRDRQRTRCAGFERDGRGASATQGRPGQADLAASRYVVCRDQSRAGARQSAA